MKLKITSDGTSAGTKIQDSDIGPLLSVQVREVDGGMEFLITTDFAKARNVITEFLRQAQVEMNKDPLGLNLDEAALFEKLDGFAANYKEH